MCSGAREEALAGKPGKRGLGVGEDDDEDEEAEEEGRLYMPARTWLDGVVGGGGGVVVESLSAAGDDAIGG